jgi:Amino acid synthesis
MGVAIRKWATFVEEVHIDGRPAAEPLVKAAVAAVIANPYAGRWSDDLEELIGPSGELARELVARCAGALGGRAAEGMGKGAIVGTAGEQEHGVACLTTPFGDAMREGIGGLTWVTSTTKVAAAGTPLDVPLAYKRALFVREFYDAITIAVPDGPRPGEVVVVAAMSSRGRLQHRVGGLTKAEATAGDGLR